MHHRGIAAALLTIAILGIVYGAVRLFRDIYLLSSMPLPPVSAFLAFAIAAVALWAAPYLHSDLRVLQPDRRDETDAHSGLRTGAYLFSRNWRLSLLTVAISASISVLLMLPRLTDNSDYRLVSLAWLSSVVLYGLAFLPRRGQSSAGRTLRSRLTYSLPVVGVVLLAAVLRLWSLGNIPFTLGGDEASQGLEALRVLRGEIRNPFSTGWYSVPTMSFFFNSLSLAVLGPTVTALRLPWALVGTLTVAVVFCLVARVKGTVMATATAGLLATYHYHIHFSRLGSNQIGDPLLAAAALLFLDRAFSRGTRLDWVFTGGISGLALYFYAGARFVPVLLVGIIAFSLGSRGKSSWTAHWRGMSAGLGGFLVVAAPILQHALRFPHLFFQRVNEVGIIQSGWLVEQAELIRTSVGRVLVGQFLRSALAFNYFEDGGLWYGLKSPLLDPLYGAFFAVGLTLTTLWLLSRRAHRGMFTFVAWWWGVVVFGGMLTKDAPATQRLVTLTVPVCFFSVLAMERLFRLAHVLVPGLSIRVFLSVGVALFAAISLNTYFVGYTPRRLYAGPNSEIATELAPLLRPYVGTHSIYLLGRRGLSSDFPTLGYLAPELEMIDVPQTPEGMSRSACPEQSAVFVALPSRSSELDRLREACAGGSYMDIERTGSDRTLAKLYIVP